MLRLRVAGGRYGKTRALVDRSVRIDGVEIEYAQMRPSESIFRMATQEEFDVAEYSLSQLVIEASRDVERFVALPVFPSKSFRHRDIYLAAGSDIAEPDALRGRRVAVQRYHVTASVWTRGILSDKYHVLPQDIVWCKADTERPGLPPTRVRLELPADVRIERIADASIDELLRVGRVDAAILPDAPPAFRDVASGVERLFRRPEIVEREYFRESGVFPVIHVVVMKRAVSEKHPGLLEEVYEAFERARLQWRDHLETAGMQEAWSAFTVSDFPRCVTSDIDRFWSYGVGPNSAALETFVRYAWEQELLRRKVGVSELFEAWTGGTGEGTEKIADERTPLRSVDIPAGRVVVDD